MKCLLTSKAGIIVVTHSACQKICVYRVHISWTPSTWDPSLPKQSNLYPVPSFRFTHCNVETPSNIWSTHQNPENPGEASSSANSLYTLTHLEIVFGTVDNPAGSTASPWILAVYSNPLHATPDHPQQHGSVSIMVRWQLDTASQTLHPKFDEVSQKNTNAQIKVCYENSIQ